MLALLPLVLVLAALWIGESSAVCSGPSKRAVAGRELETLAQMTEKYALLRGHPPRRIEQLVDAGLLRELTKDPWGGDYELLVSEDGERWATRCAGPDREHGTLDDLFAR